MFDTLSIFNAFIAGLCIGFAIYSFIDKNKLLSIMLMIVACLNIVSVFA